MHQNPHASQNSCVKMLTNQSESSWLNIISTYHIYLNQKHPQSECLSELLQAVMDIVWVEIVVPQTLCKPQDTKTKHTREFKYE